MRAMMIRFDRNLKSLSGKIIQIETMMRSRLKGLNYFYSYMLIGVNKNPKKFQSKINI